MESGVGVSMSPQAMPPFASGEVPRIARGALVDQCRISPNKVHADADPKWQVRSIKIIK